MFGPYIRWSVSEDKDGCSHYPSLLFAGNRRIERDVGVSETGPAKW